MSLRLRRRDTGEEWEITPGALVGRLAECPIAVRDLSVSRRHARVEEREDGLWLVDLGSANGTRYNGRRVRECRLRPGDLLTLGTVALDVVGESAAPALPMAPGENGEDRREAGEDVAARAAAERARIRAEMRRLERNRGLGDLGQLAFRYQLLAVLLGLAAMAGMAWLVVHLGELLARP